MNLSRVKTNSSTSSDFSIDKILSDDSKSRSNCTTAPSWVCCTRYQPPRLPRAVSAGRARRSGRHARVPFTSGQAAALEAAYARSPYLAPPALRALAAALQLRDDRIKIWFQNRRARERREKIFIVNPSQAVSLPSTSIMQRNVPPQQTDRWTTNVKNHSPRDPVTYESDMEKEYGTPSSEYVWQSISSSEDFNISIIRSESPLDVETVVD